MVKSKNSIYDSTRLSKSHDLGPVLAGLMWARARVCMARTDGGAIDLIKMKVIDSVVNLQHLVYIIQKAESLLGSYIKMSPPHTTTSPMHHHSQQTLYILMLYGRH